MSDLGSNTIVCIRVGLNNNIINGILIKTSDIPLKFSEQSSEARIVQKMEFFIPRPMFVHYVITFCPFFAFNTPR